MVSGRMARGPSLRKAEAPRPNLVVEFFSFSRPALARYRTVVDALRPEAALADGSEHALAAAGGVASVRSSPHAHPAHPPVRRAWLPSQGSTTEKPARYGFPPQPSTQEAAPGTHEANTATQATRVGERLPTQARGPDQLDVGWARRKNAARGLGWPGSMFMRGSGRGSPATETGGPPVRIDSSAAGLPTCRSHVQDPVERSRATARDQKTAGTAGNRTERSMAPGTEWQAGRDKIAGATQTGMRAMRTHDPINTLTCVVLAYAADFAISMDGKRARDDGGIRVTRRWWAIEQLAYSPAVNGRLACACVSQLLRVRLTIMTIFVSQLRQCNTQSTLSWTIDNTSASFVPQFRQCWQLTIRRAIDFLRDNSMMTAQFAQFATIFSTLQIDSHHPTTIHCIRLGRTGFPSDGMPRKTEKEKGLAQAGDHKLQSLNQAMRQIVLTTKAEAGVACGLDQEEEKKRRRVQARIESLQKAEAQEKQAAARHQAEAAATTDIKEAMMEVQRHGAQLNDCQEQAAVHHIQTRIPHINLGIAKQTANMTHLLAKTPTHEPTVQQMLREAEVRVRLLGPAGTSMQVAQQVANATKWAQEQGCEVMDQTPVGKGEHGCLALLFTPAAEIVAAVVKSSKLQIAGVTFDAKILRPPEAEIDLRPVRNEGANLHTIVQHAKQVGLSVVELEKFLEMSLKASVDTETAARIEYVRIELSRLFPPGSKKQWLDTFGIGQAKGSDPRITVGVARDLQAQMVNEPVFAEINIGPHRKHHILTAGVKLSSKERFTAGGGPASQQEALAMIRGTADASAKEFEKRMRGLLTAVSVTEEQLGKQGEAQATEQLREALIPVPFWPEQEAVEAIEAEYGTLRVAMDQGMAYAELTAALQAFAKALSTYREGAWSQQRGDEGVLWVTPTQLGEFQERVDPGRANKRDTSRWGKAIRKALNERETGLTGDAGGPISINVTHAQVLVEKTGRQEVNIAAGFAIAVMNYAEVQRALMKNKGEIWLQPLRVKVNLKLLGNTDQSVAAEGLAAKIMRLCAEGALLFFDPMNFRDTGHMCTQLSDVEAPRDEQPYHIASLHARLQVSYSDAESTPSVLGKLRAAGKLGTVPINGSMAAYGRADILSVLNRWALHPRWTDNLQIGQDATPVVRAALQECIRAAIYDGADRGCWLEEQSMEGGGGPALQLEETEADVLGPNMVGTVLNKLEFLMKFPDATRLVAEAVSTMLAEKSVTAIGAGSSTLLIRDDNGLNPAGMQTHGSAIRIGYPLPLEALEYQESKAKDMERRMVGFLREHSSIIAEGLVGCQPFHWVKVPACPIYAQRIAAPTLLRILVGNQHNGSATMELSEWTQVLLEDMLEIQVTSRVFVQEQDLESGWIPTVPFSIAHAMMAPTCPAHEALGKRILDELVKKGCAITVTVSPSEQGIPWTVYVSARMRHGLPVAATAQEWLPKITSSLRNSMRIAIRREGREGRVSRTAMADLIAAKVQEAEALSLIEAITQAEAPYVLPLQPNGQLEEGMGTGDRQARQLLRVIPHSLITTQAGVRILWEELKDLPDVVCKRAGDGCIIIGKDSKLAEVAQEDFDEMDVGGEDPVGALELKLQARAESAAAAEALGKEEWAAASEQGQQVGDEAEKTQKRKQVTEAGETLLAMQTGDAVMAEGEDAAHRSKKRTEGAGPGQSTSESGREQRDGAAMTPE